MAGRIMATVLLTAAILTATSIPATAFAPPYAFGGGERAVHINGNPVVDIIAPVHANHISTKPQDYEYGSFLGVLSVERLERVVNVYGGATIESMSAGAGHFSFTGLNEGNTGLIGHNRGSNGYFGFVRLLQEGDTVSLDMAGTVRTYRVVASSIVDETDFSYLQQFGMNRLTLITCLENVRNQRRIVVCEEI